MDTPYGPVSIKQAQGMGVTHTKPEYEDVARIARERNLPLSQVWSAADAAGRKDVCTRFSESRRVFRTGKFTLPILTPEIPLCIHSKSLRFH